MSHRDAGVESTLDLDALNRWRGRRRESTDVIRAQPARFMRATIDQDWYGASMEVGDELPCAWHWLYFLDAARIEALGRDGHPLRGDFMPPVALPRRMWAGGRIEFIEMIRIGDTIRRISTVTDIARKTGRSGELCFVTIRHEFFRGDATVMIEEQDIVYREDPAPGDSPSPASSPSPSSPAPSLPTVTDTSTVVNTVIHITPTPVMLFRYSALTFNSHRIHYDADYCRAVEGFPGPVVHGSLTATLLAGLAAQHGGDARPRRFAYRAVSPLYADAPVTLSAREQDAGVRLQAANARGELAMTAQMEFA